MPPNRWHGKNLYCLLSETFVLVCAGLEIYGILFMLAIPNLKWRDRNTSSKLILQIKLLTIFSLGVKNCMNAQHEEALGLNSKQFTLLWLHVNGLNMINSLCIHIILSCWVYQLNEYICCCFFGSSVNLVQNLVVYQLDLYWCNRQRLLLMPRRLIFCWFD